MLPLGSLRDHAETLCIPGREARIAEKIGTRTIGCRMSNVEARVATLVAVPRRLALTFRVTKPWGVLR